MSEQVSPQKRPRRGNAPQSADLHRSDSIPEMDRKRRHTNRDAGLDTLAGLEVAIRRLIRTQFTHGRTARKLARAILPGVGDGNPKSMQDVVKGFGRLGLPLTQDDEARLSLLLGAERGFLSLESLTSSLTSMAEQQTSNSWPERRLEAQISSGANPRRKAASDTSDTAKAGTKSSSANVPGITSQDVFASADGVPEFGRTTRSRRQAHEVAPSSAAEMADDAELRAIRALEAEEDTRRKASAGFDPSSFGEQSQKQKQASRLKGSSGSRSGQRRRANRSRQQGEIPHGVPFSSFGSGLSAAAAPTERRSGLLHKRRPDEADAAAGEAGGSGSDSGSRSRGRGHSRSGAASGTDGEGELGTVNVDEDEDSPFFVPPLMMRQSSDDKMAETLSRRRRVAGDADVGAVTMRAEDGQRRKYVDAFRGAAHSPYKFRGTAWADTGKGKAGASKKQSSLPGAHARRRRRIAGDAGSATASSGKPPRQGRKLSVEAVHALLGARHLGVHAATKAAAQAQLAAQLSGSSATHGPGLGTTSGYASTSSGRDSTDGEGDGDGENGRGDGEGGRLAGWSALRLRSSEAFRVVSAGLIALGELMREGRLELAERAAAKERLFSGDAQVVALLLRFLETAAQRQVVAQASGVPQARGRDGRTAEENAVLDVLEGMGRSAAKQRAVPAGEDPSMYLRGVMPEDDAADEAEMGVGGAADVGSAAHRGVVAGGRARDAKGIGIGNGSGIDQSSRSSRANAESSVATTGVGQTFAAQRSHSEDAVEVEFEVDQHPELHSPSPSIIRMPEAEAMRRRGGGHPADPAAAVSTRRNSYLV